MKTITKEFNVYTLEDVKQDKDLLEKVLEKHRLINIENLDWYEFIFESCEERLQELGYNNIKIAFTGFWSQGDGASFTGDIYLTSEVLNRLGVTEGLKKSQIELIKEYVQDAKIERNNYIHYVHENSTFVEVNMDYTNRDKIDIFLEKKASDIEKALSKEVYNLNCEIYKTLSDSYDELISDEIVLETLESNEYEFDINGNIF